MSHLSTTILLIHMIWWTFHVLRLPNIGWKRNTNIVCIGERVTCCIDQSRSLNAWKNTFGKRGEPCIRTGKRTNNRMLCYYIRYGTYVWVFIPLFGVLVTLLDILRITKDDWMQCMPICIFSLFDFVRWSEFDYSRYSGYSFLYKVLRITGAK